jgi:hypothetical protein
MPQGQIDYHVELKEANFHGKHSNVITIGVKTNASLGSRG